MADTQLTDREQQVLHLLGEGFSNRQIAAALHLSESTVKAHVAGIFQRLGVGNRTEAVAAGVHRGLIRLTSGTE
jgi:DNA-binding NarL/FixJ family response regulator